MRAFLKAAFWTVFYAVRGTLIVALIVVAFLALLWLLFSSIWAFSAFTIIVLLACGHDEYRTSTHGKTIMPTKTDDTTASASEKQPYTTPKLTTFGSIKDTTAGSGDRFCPNGQPKPPTGNCGHQGHP